MNFEIWTFEFCFCFFVFFAIAFVLPWFSQLGSGFQNCWRYKIFSKLWFKFCNHSYGKTQCAKPNLVCKWLVGWWCSSCQPMGLYTISSNLLKTQTFKWVGCSLPQSKQNNILICILLCFASSTLTCPFSCICKPFLLVENLVMFVTIYLFPRT
jgi:hypothetical protein